MKRSKRFLRRSVLTAVAVMALMSLAGRASALSVTYSTTNLTNLVHQSAYTWQINNINVNGGTITGATLHFYGFYNWTSAASDPNNILWVSLADSAVASANGAIGSATDNTNGSTLTSADVLDGFRYGPLNNNVYVKTTLLGANAMTYVGSSTNASDASITGYNPAGSALGTNAGAFGTTPVNWDLAFGSTAVAALINYFNNGQNLALAFDSDCHFGDSSVALEIFYNPAQQQAVPEPTSLILVGTGVFALYRRQRRQRAL